MRNLFLLGAIAAGLAILADPKLQRRIQRETSRFGRRTVKSLRKIRDGYQPRLG